MYKSLCISEIVASGVMQLACIQMLMDCFSFGGCSTWVYFPLSAENKSRKSKLNAVFWIEKHRQKYSISIVCIPRGSNHSKTISRNRNRTKSFRICSWIFLGLKVNIIMIWFCVAISEVIRLNWSRHGIHYTHKKVSVPSIWIQLKKKKNCRRLFDFSNFGFFDRFLGVVVCRVLFFSSVQNVYTHILKSKVTTTRTHLPARTIENYQGREGEAR